MSNLAVARADRQQEFHTTEASAGEVSAANLILFSIWVKPIGKKLNLKAMYSAERFLLTIFAFTWQKYILRI